MVPSTGGATTAPYGAGGVSRSVSLPAGGG